MENQVFTLCLVEAIGVRLIALVKFQSARAASHNPAFMSGCLTISHT